MEGPKSFVCFDTYSQKRAKGNLKVIFFKHFFKVQDCRNLIFASFVLHRFAIVQENQWTQYLLFLP